MKMKYFYLFLLALALAYSLKYSPHTVVYSGNTDTEFSGETEYQSEYQNTGNNFAVGAGYQLGYQNNGNYVVHIDRKRLDPWQDSILVEALEKITGEDVPYVPKN